MNIFSNITIIDLSQVFSGPFATRHFSDYGAQVIKVEPPNGDSSRDFPPLKNDGTWSGYFETVNRNKTCQVIDLKTQVGKNKLYKICEKADILVENFSPNVTKKLGIDFQTIKKINPRLIYASLSGISPNIDRKYYDVLAQAESGLMSLNGETNDMKNSTSIIDAFSGLKLAHALSSALYHREKTNEALHIFVSMRGSAFDLLEQNLIESSLSKKNPKKVGNMDSAIAPFGVFKTQNGNIVLAIGSQLQWNSFNKIFKTLYPQYSEDLFLSNILRIKNIKILIYEIEQAFGNNTNDELIEILTKQNIPCAKVHTMLDVLSNNENKVQGLLEDIYIEGIGTCTVSTGGIFFDQYSKERYKQSPSLH